MNKKNLKIILLIATISIFTGCDGAQTFESSFKSKLTTYENNKEMIAERTSEVSTSVDKKIEKALQSNARYGKPFTDVEMISDVLLKNFTYTYDTENKDAISKDDWSSLSTEDGKFIGDCEDFHLLLRDKLVKFTNINPSEIKLAIGDQFRTTDGELEKVSTHAWLIVEGEFVNYDRVFKTQNFEDTLLMLELTLDLN